MLVNSPAFSSTITVSMVSPVAMTTKRCEKKRSVRGRQAGRQNEKLVNPGREREREMFTLARGAPRAGVASRTRPSPETKSA